MTQYVAFLRAINVAGRYVKMPVLRELFFSLGFENVDTFIASGNVIFESGPVQRNALEAGIEAALFSSLGFEVAVFIRSVDELVEIAAQRPFPAAQMDAARACSIGFLADILDESARDIVFSFASEFDAFHVEGREIHWLSQKRQSDSPFSTAALERRLKRKTTWRGANTVRRLAEKVRSSG